MTPAVAGQDRVIPDLTFAPAGLGPFLDAPSWMRPPGAAMVAEVTSSQPELDRRAKRRAHAAARIPLYLLIDRDEKRVLLFSGPARDEYVSTSPVPFGNSLELPAPFSFTLEADGLAT